jgi:hypothetical protein
MKNLCGTLIFVCAGISTPFVYGSYLAIIHSDTVNYSQAMVVIGITITCLFGLAGLVTTFASYLEQKKQNGSKVQELVFNPIKKI